MDSFLSPSSISSLQEIECTPDYIKLDGNYFYSDRFYLNDLNRYQDLEDIQSSCQSSGKENKNNEETGGIMKERRNKENKNDMKKRIQKNEMVKEMSRKKTTALRPLAKKKVVQNVE